MANDSNSNSNEKRKRNIGKSKTVSDRELREKSDEKFKAEKQAKAEAAEKARQERLAKIDAIKKRIEESRKTYRDSEYSSFDDKARRREDFERKRYDWRRDARNERRTPSANASPSQEFEMERINADYRAREEEDARKRQEEDARKRAENEKRRHDRKNAAIFGKSVKLFADTVKHASEGDALGVLSNVGKAGMMSGNPYAMVAGMGLQAITKIADVYEGFRMENVQTGQLTGQNVGSVARETSFKDGVLKGLFTNDDKATWLNNTLGLSKSEMQERFASQSLNQGTLATQSQLIRQRAMENTLGLDTRGMSTYMRAMKGGDFEESSLRLIDKLSATSNGNISKNNMVLANEKANQLMQMQQYYAYKQNYSKTSDIENMLLATNALGGAGSDFRAANTATMLQEDMKFGGSQNKQMFQMGVAKKVAMQEGITGQAEILSRAYDIAKAGTDPKYLAGITSELDKMSQGNAWTKKLTYSQFFGNQSQDVVNSLIEKGGGFREALLNGDRSTGTGINKDYVVNNSTNAVSLIDSFGNALSNSVKTFSDAIMIFTNGVDKFSETTTKEANVTGN